MRRKIAQREVGPPSPRSLIAATTRSSLPTVAMLVGMALGCRRGEAIRPDPLGKAPRIPVILVQPIEPKPGSAVPIDVAAPYSGPLAPPPVPRPKIVPPPKRPPILPKKKPVDVVGWGASVQPLDLGETRLG